MIYAILMAGGRGTRLKVPCEKPLFELHDKPLIKYVLDNLKESKLIDKIIITVSPHSCETTRYLESLDDDFEILNKLHEEEYIYQENKHKYFIWEEKGILEAERLIEKYNINKD